LEFGAPLYSHFATTYLSALEKTETSALRIILGVPVTTNIKAMYVEANLQPLKLRLKTLAATTYLRITLGGKTTRLEPMIDLSREERLISFRASTKGSQKLRVLKDLVPILDTSGGLVTMDDIQNFELNQINIDLTGINLDPSELQSTWDHSISADINDIKFFTAFHIDKMSGVIQIAIMEINPSSMVPDITLIKLPEFTVLKYAPISTVVAVLNIIAHKGYPACTVIMEDYSFVMGLRNMQQNYFSYCISWARPSFITSLTIMWKHPDIESINMKEVKRISSCLQPNLLTSIVLPSDYGYLKSRIKARDSLSLMKSQHEFALSNETYKHLKYKWPVETSRSRGTETTITRIRLNRSRLRDDLFRWRIVDSPICLMCNNAAETAFHCFFVCQARQEYRAELDEFFAREDITNPMNCVLSLGCELEAKDARLLQVLVEQFLLDSGLARS
jgi:hypothetical protein